MALKRLRVLDHEAAVVLPELILFLKFIFFCFDVFVGGCESLRYTIGQGQTPACVFLRSAPSVDPLPRILLHSEWILGDDDDQLYWKETYLSGRVRKWLE